MITQLLFGLSRVYPISFELVEAGASVRWLDMHFFFEGDGFNFVQANYNREWLWGSAAVRARATFDAELQEVPPSGRPQVATAQGLLKSCSDLKPLDDVMPYRFS